MKKKVILFLVLIYSHHIEIFSDQSEDINNRLLQYNNKKVSYKVKKRFDIMYPQDVNEFFIYQGDKEISLSEFIGISNDPLLIKNREMIKNTKIVGTAAGVIFGIIGGTLLIPSIIFIYNQTTDYQTQDPNYSNYTITGAFMIGFSIASWIGLIIDLTVVFSLLNYYNNERVIREAIERYNEKLRKELLSSGFGFSQNSDIFFQFKVKL